MLVAVAPDKFAVAVGSPRAVSRPPRPAYAQLELVDALTRVWNTDAHLVSYVLPEDHRLVASRRQPRLAKQAPADVLAATLFTTVFVDVDNPGHAKWTPELHDAALAAYAEIPLPFGVYHTAKGARLILPLVSPVPVLEAEPLIRRALTMLDAYLPGVDHSAKDWTRHFRLPNVRREGQPFVTPYIDLSRMQPVTLEPLVIPSRARPTRSRREPLPPIPFTPTVAEHWQARARHVGNVVRATVPPGTWHDLFLAIAGAMLQRQTPPEHVPELVRLAAVAANSGNPSHHEVSARDSVSRYLAGQPVTGARDLAVRWPAVGDAVHDALADAARIVAPPVPSAPTSPLAATTTALEETIARAPDGLSVIAAECGLGKTHAAQRVAAARATAKRPTAKRAPAQTKTAISVDKNELAVQIAEDLAAQGVAVRRVFGPLSVLDPRTREPVCKFANRALPLVEGHQSVTWEFCLGRGRYKCEYYDTCPARDGEQLYGPVATADPDAPFSKPPAPRVTVGTHALLRELDASAGSTGLLVVDEPPPLLEALTITTEDIKLALQNVKAFERTYAEAMTPVLHALQNWSSTDYTFEDLTDTISAPPTVDPETGRKLTRPPMRAETMYACRADVVVARTIGATSRVLHALHRAMTSTDARVRLEEEPARIVIVAPREDLATALRREGAVVAMDANADLHLPGFAKVVGYDPPLHRFTANDGAPVERTMLRSGAATRRTWLSHGRLVLDTGLLSAFRAVAAWHRECSERLGRPARLGIISIRLVELVVRAAQGEDVVREWVAAKQRGPAYTETVDALKGILDLTQPIATAHYGATRGLNRLAGVDCLATLGDPWPNLGDVQAEAAYLEVDWEDRADAVASAELEQAHGRLRTVHRKVPGFALHIGRVVPGGSGWRAATAPSSDAPPVRLDALQGGRPLAGAPMPGPELRALVEALGGARGAARAVGCSHQSVLRYLAGAGVPPGVASTLRRLGKEVHGTAAE